MSTETYTHKKLLSSLIIFSLPFLPFTGFFSDKPADEGSKIGKILIETSNLSSDKAIVSDLIAPGTNLGMWVWHRKYITDPWERILMLDFCRSHGIGNVFIQVHFDRDSNGGYTIADQENWNDLLLVANALGIRVEALDGAGSMAFSINHDDTIAHLKAVLDFNKSQPYNARFSGIHYDIEPYTTPRWRSGEHYDVAVELLSLLSKLRKVVTETDPSLTFVNDIPFWYDSAAKFIIEFNGEKKYLNQHIQDISDSVGIMSYRNKMTGKNSTVEITEGELEYGSKIGRQVYLSIETVELADTPQITFYGKSAVDVASAVRELSEALKDESSYGGVFLHEYNTLRSIGEQWDLSEIND